MARFVAAIALGAAMSALATSAVGRDSGGEGRVFTLAISEDAPQALRERDPRTLLPRGRPLLVPADSYPASLSPDGSILVLLRSVGKGVHRREISDIVDLRRWRARGSINLPANVSLYDALRLDKASACSVGVRDLLR